MNSLQKEEAIFNAVANLCLPENAPEQRAAYERYETAIYRHGVYEAAAQGLAHVNREAATATGAHLEALEAARNMIYARFYSTETLKALARAKTFKERQEIAKKAEYAATAKREAEQAARNAEADRKQAVRMAEEAREKKEREEREGLDREYKKAMISIAAKGTAPAPVHAAATQPKLHDGAQYGNYTVIKNWELIEAKGRGKPKTYRFTAPKIWDALAVLLPAVDSNKYVNMTAHKMDDFPSLFRETKRLEGSQLSAKQFKAHCLEHREDAHGGNSTGGKWWRLKTQPENE